MPKSLAAEVVAFQSKSSLSIVLLIALVVVTPVFAADPGGSTNAGPASVPELSRRAIAYEQQGERLKAAEAYERIIALDPPKQRVLANRLVKLYAEAGSTNQALEWARCVMTNSPDPQAYLAGVNAMVGRRADAIAILEKEIAKTDEPRRRLTLNWQLADICQAGGDLVKAEGALKAAAAAARGTPDEAAATNRLARFRGKAPIDRPAVAP